MLGVWGVFEHTRFWGVLGGLWVFGVISERLECVLWVSFGVDAPLSYVAGFWVVFGVGDLGGLGILRCWVVWLFLFACVADVRFCLVYGSYCLGWGLVPGCVAQRFGVVCLSLFGWGLDLFAGLGGMIWGFVCLYAASFGLYSILYSFNFITFLFNWCLPGF